MKTLKIGTFELPLYSGLEVTQSYEPIGGETILRTVSGAGIKQWTYDKTRITTSGSGWVPSGLLGLDFTVTHDVYCIVPETLVADFSTRSAEILVGYRTDSGHVPYGLAQTQNGDTVEVAVTVDANNIATAAATTGAVSYQIGYYPLFACWLMRPSRSGPDYSWELVAEEA